MNNYRTGDIRNIAVLGGSGSGKTTLVEAAAFAGENKNYLGSIAQGNTVSDYDSEGTQPWIFNSFIGCSGGMERL